MSVLTDIQNELKAPKSRYNSFGKYNYRSLEDVLEAAKPLLSKYGATLWIKDEIVEVGGRIYVKATARLQYFPDGKLSEGYETSAFARESDTKKGMDASQITGTASSYARKSALNGLFLIDDTKDADTEEFAEQAIAGKKIGKVKAAALETELNNSGQNVAKIMEYYNVENLADLTEEQQSDIIQRINHHGNNRKN